MSLTFTRRQRLLFAWLLIGLLIGVLLVREGLARWAELHQWRALAESAVRLQHGPPMGLDALRQSAESRAISLCEIEPQDGDWRVRGNVDDAQPLLAWLQALQAEGVQPLQWGLEQDGKRLRFDLRLRP